MKLTAVLALSVFATVALAQGDIPAVAADAGGFDTLLTALEAADLVDDLSSPNGPFTVFAPTDDAFSAISSDLLECLQRPAYQEVLQQILLHHVVDGRVASTDLTAGDVATLNEDDVTVDLSNGVTISGASVLTADVAADNGIIHAIDRVLIPEDIDVDNLATLCAGQDIIDVAGAEEDFSSLVDAITAAGLVNNLKAPNGPFTVFAPNNNAFDTLPNGLVECLLRDENIETLTTILTYHVLEQEVMSGDLVDGADVETLNGATVTVGTEGNVTINEAIVLAADTEASNGVIHTIDRVLLPADIDVAAFLDSCAAAGTDTPASPNEPSSAAQIGGFATLFLAAFFMN